jgi:hypothetical protein
MTIAGSDKAPSGLYSSEELDSQKREQKSAKEGRFSLF